MPVTANKMLKVNVQSDKHVATLSLNGNTFTAAISAEEIAEQVQELGIILNDEGREAIVAFAEELAGEKVPEPVVVARGKPPVNDKNGALEKLYHDPKDYEEPSDQPEDRPATASESHYDRSCFVMVEEDQSVLRILPPVAGEDGVDVYGKAIPRKLGREVHVIVGQHVRQDGDCIVAECDGKLEFVGNKVWIDTKVEVSGSVDFSVGNIDFPGDVTIAKNVLDLFKVRSKKDVAVMGVIEAADVHAGNDLYGTGGMTGKEKGHYTAGHDIKAKYITNATVHAGNNVEVHAEIVNCDLVCSGKVIIENGLLVGGHTVATNGVKVKQLGSEADVRTLVDVGLDGELRRLCLEYAPEIDQRRRKAKKVRSVVETLLQNQKYLNSEQKEKATELLYQSYELDEEVDKMVDELRKLFTGQEGEEKVEPEIEVLGAMYPGVTLRFPKVEAFIKSPLKGPIKIGTRESAGVLQIVAVDSQSGAAYALESGANADPFWETLDRLLNPPDTDE